MESDESDESDTSDTSDTSDRDTWCHFPLQGLLSQPDCPSRAPCPRANKAMAQRTQHRR